MATQWSTFPIEFKGGLISNMSPMQQGVNAIGSATILQNMEADRQGGYSKIKGYKKYSSSEIPGVGNVIGLHVVSSGRALVARKIDAAAVTELQTATASVNGATTSSNAVVLDGNSGTIEAGMFVTGGGITGDVTVATVNDQNNIVLSSVQSLADDAALTFGHLSSTEVSRTAYYMSTGTNWTHLITSAQSGGGKVRKAMFNYSGDDQVVFVDGLHYPMVYNTSGNTTEYLSSSTSNINTDVEGAQLVTIFKNHTFYAKDSLLFFTIPFSVSDFSAGSGAGSINVGSDITGLAVFREQLIIFTADSVKKLTGDTSSDFKLQPITEKLGCINADSVQEFGGDIMYLAPDGLRLLSATDRIGDFGLDVASDKIYKDSDDFLSSTTQFCSVILREKGQYRIFAFLPTQLKAVAQGLIATKFEAQGAENIQWSTTKGIKAFLADSIYTGTLESVMFVNEDGFLYEMEETNAFDGSSIETVVETPYMPITDSEIRKTAYKLTLYTDPAGRMDLKFRLLFNFDSGGDSRIVQPEEITISSATGGSGVFMFGAANSVLQDRLVTNPTPPPANILNPNLTINGGTTETVIYGSKVKKVFNENLVGSFHTVAMRITSDNTNPPFTLDSAVLQYRQNDRQ